MPNIIIVSYGSKTIIDNQSLHKDQKALADTHRRLLNKAIELL